MYICSQLETENVYNINANIFMRKVLFLLCVFICSIQFMKAEDANNPYVHCIVLDKTMSMTGHGGTNIWADVQNYCCEWIDGIPQSSTVLFFTFDQKLYGPQKFVIESDNDKTKIKDAVKNVKVDGQRTWISSSLDEAIKHIHNNYPKSQFNSRIYLITDGKEEQQGADFAKVLRNYGSWRGDFDYLYYVDLRNLAPQSTRQAIENTDGADLGTGFAKFMTISPMIKKVNCVLGGSKTFEQHFLVSNESLFSSMSFDVKIDSIKNIGEGNVVPNVTLSPSRNITKASTKKMEDGKYKMNFSLNFINESACECDIYVTLAGRSQADKVINFEPGGFVIQVRNKPIPKVKVLNGGWH